MHYENESVGEFQCENQKCDGVGWCWMSDEDGNDDGDGEIWDERNHGQNDGVAISHQTGGEFLSQ